VIFRTLTISSMHAQSRPGHPPARSIRSLALVFLAAAAAACTGDTAGSNPSPPPGLHVLSGAGVSDSIEAILPAELVVELRDHSRRPAVGVPIRFSSELAGFMFTSMVSRSGSGEFSTVVLDTTDAHGRASVRVRLGMVLGPVRIVAAVLADTLVKTTAVYTVHPGAPASIDLSPPDTVLYAGRSYTLAATVRDRAGNPRGDAPQYAVLTPEKVRLSGGTVETLAVGRGAVSVSAGGVFDTAFVSIPPPGAFTAVRTFGSGNEDRVQIHTMNFDGSERSILVRSLRWSEPGHSWSPDGHAVAFSLGDHDTGLYVRDAGGERPLFDPSASGLWSAAFPRHSRDGAWIYFNGRTGGVRTELWRVRSAGGGAERIGPAGNDYSKDAGGDPSPDGTRVVYSTNRVNVTTPVLRVLTLADRSVAALDIPGVTPRWSPDGQWIAYVTSGPQWGYLEDSRAMAAVGALTLMRPDGTERRTIPTGTKRFRPHFDWSPDGRYILAIDSDDAVAIVDVQSGETIPVARSYILPNWRP